MPFMGRVGTAFRAFFRVLGDGTVAVQIGRLLDGQPAAGAAEPAVQSSPAMIAAPVAPVVAASPTRSDALTLLSVLQREARLVDFLKENIAGYTDDQVGAAVREIHRDAAAALDRMFALKPVRTEVEGANVAVPAGYDAGRVRLVGTVSGSAASQAGTLAHAGWEAARVELPQWAGTASAATVVTPAEVEVR